MTQPVDIDAVVAKQKFLEGRDRFSDTAGVFARLADYRDGGIFAGGFSGTSQWERHPNGDEIVQILKGSVTLSIIQPDGTKEAMDLKAGMLAIVPQGAWHQFFAPDGVTLMTTTPQPTEHITDEHPPVG